ncbi:MAG TPA: DUF393 domain-containing protein, partial [Mucilaginibacter sp.]|nr:DUF393 domain-containing protein [Mucilaginibacter sp.]
MKTLKNHIILYDAECPVCTLYARTLTKNGMLAAEGRESYQQMPEAVCPYVDRQRAANEIALVNTQTGEVSYGIHGVFKLIGNSFPFLRPLFALRPFIWLMSKLYAFFSFNRRVIIPSTTKNSSAIQPAFRLRYRTAWLLFTWVAVGFILTHYARLLTGFVPLGNSYREYFICGGQIIFQGIIVSMYAPAKRWDYLGNMMTISFAGALLLIPVILLKHFIQ